MADHPAFLLIDRTAALFCGVAAGIAIGLAFAPQLNTLLSDAPPGLPAPVTSPAGAPPAADGLPADVVAAANVPAGLARAVAQGRPFRIGVFGDSFGDGLWAALYNQLPRREAFHVLQFSQQGTGFTRYRQTNLEQALAGQLSEGPVDVAVISFGANDVQGIFVDGRVAPLLSPLWQAEIAARITRYVGMLRDQGADVVWIGLPVMRDPAFDAQVQGLNAFHAGVMARLKVPFIDTRQAAVGPDGLYVSHLPDKLSGAPWLVRAGDGIHMSMKGYRLLTAALAVRVRAWGQAARRGKAVPPELVPPPVALPQTDAAKVDPALAEPAMEADSAPAQAMPLPTDLLPVTPPATELVPPPATPPQATPPQVTPPQA